MIRIEKKYVVVNDVTLQVIEDGMHLNKVVYNTLTGEEEVLENVEVHEVNPYTIRFGRDLDGFVIELDIDSLILWDDLEMEG